MAISKTSICNVALTHLGELKIDSVEDDNQRARLCKLRFDDVLNIVLKSHPWTCVIKRSTLSKLTTDSGENKPDWGFNNMFQLPSDFLRILQVQDHTQPYRIETDSRTDKKIGNGLVLLSNSSTAKIRYICRPSDIPILSYDVANLVGIRLASELVEPLTSNVSLKQSLTQRYLIELAAARSIDSMQGTPEVIDNYSWLNARSDQNQAAVVFDIPVTDTSGLNPSPNWNIP